MYYRSTENTFSLLVSCIDLRYLHSCLLHRLWIKIYQDASSTSFASMFPRFTTCPIYPNPKLQRNLLHFWGSIERPLAPSAMCWFPNGENDSPLVFGIGTFLSIIRTCPTLQFDKPQKNPLLEETVFSHVKTHRSTIF